jgi:hypothetical protein
MNMPTPRLKQPSRTDDSTSARPLNQIDCPNCGQRARAVEEHHGDTAMTVCSHCRAEVNPEWRRSLSGRPLQVVSNHGKDTGTWNAKGTATPSEAPRPVPLNVTEHEPGSDRANVPMPRSTEPAKTGMEMSSMTPTPQVPVGQKSQRDTRPSTGEGAEEQVERKVDREPDEGTLDEEIEESTDTDTDTDTGDDTLSQPKPKPNKQYKKK